MIPPLVFSSASMRLTTTRACSGRIGVLAMVMSFALVSVLGIDRGGQAALERNRQSHFGSANGVAEGKYGLALFLSSKRHWLKTLVSSLYDSRRPSSAFVHQALRELRRLPGRQTWFMKAV